MTTTKRKISEETARDRETYRCAQCGKFIEHETDGFFDREDRANDCSTVLLFCNEAHADKFHAK